jgi:ABC-type lipoprotein release transport system permease subunit
MFLLSLINLGFETPLYLFLKNGHLTFKFVPMLAGNILIVEALTLLAAYLPARQAARLEPARALGTHY